VHQPCGSIEGGHEPRHQLLAEAIDRGERDPGRALIDCLV
jgi:hypothetical protein